MAMPASVFGGMAEKNASNAARPPAEAPMPTMGKPPVGGGLAASSALSLGPEALTLRSGAGRRAGARAVGAFFFDGRFAAIKPPPGRRPLGHTHGRPISSLWLLRPISGRSAPRTVAVTSIEPPEFTLGKRRAKHG